MPVAIKNKDEAAQMVSKLGSQRINNIFTHLRKICQHPLLVRHHFNDDKVKEIAEVASANKLFGGNCTVPRVLQEISGGCPCFAACLRSCSCSAADRLLILLGFFCWLVAVAYSAVACCVSLLHNPPQLHRVPSS
jgi:hypothetical protein